ncbi:serine/threonine-protein kinase [Krasilnikovia cinnamomea]|uniref:non-specific serine/threonine protein kinase n=1 Tax=Krasilnikovia cinnamomea TaxID=349313 RepID=A0A4Q7ZNV2_9ACTN|nr:serine/threonine-protein kinase [Krasilnikovia cinnamomea]RZU52722.1 serine/threonine-protein kinase [Krasilnikovia cinnamomea]
MLSSGHLLDNRYRLDERIATGGMGDVWRGTDIVLGRTIAVKVLRQNMISDPEFAARFYGEARMMAAFRHPGVVEVYDYASAGDPADETQCAYLVMAYVDGEPLSTRLKEQGALEVAETMSIVAQAADALHAAHLNGTVHRDVKPGNLIVKPNGTVILVDFGVARSNAVTSVTGLNAIVGTALYMAPEQVAKGNVTPATDIYALGAVAYHCIAGHPPFDGDNALQVALRHLEEEPEPLPGDVSLPVRHLISRAMAKSPDDRFASAAEFADAALAAAGPMDWRSLTGTGMTTAHLTGTSLASPAGARLTGTQLTAPPLTVPVPRAPVAAPPQRSLGQRSRFAGLLILLGLAAVIIGFGIAFASMGGGGGESNGGTVNPPSVEASTDTGVSDEPVEPTRTFTTTRAPNKPAGTPQHQSSPASAPPSATPSTAPSTTAPTTETPTTTPTTQTTTTTPTQSTTTTPTTAPTGGGGDGEGVGPEAGGGG